MLRAGLFDDVDAVVAWHPGDRNAVERGSTLANVTAKFRFRGLSAHAVGGTRTAAAPRSTASKR